MQYHKFIHIIGDFANIKEIIVAERKNAPIKAMETDRERTILGKRTYPK